MEAYLQLRHNEFGKEPKEIELSKKYIIQVIKCKYCDGIVAYSRICDISGNWISEYWEDRLSEYDSKKFKVENIESKQFNLHKQGCSCNEKQKNHSENENQKNNVIMNKEYEELISILRNRVENAKLNQERTNTRIETYQEVISILQKQKYQYEKIIGKEPKE